MRFRGERTINEIAAEHGVHPNQVSQWKSKLLIIPRRSARMYARFQVAIEKFVRIQLRRIRRQMKDFDFVFMLGQPLFRDL